MPFPAVLVPHRGRGDGLLPPLTVVAIEGAADRDEHAVRLRDVAACPLTRTCQPGWAAQMDRYAPI